MGHGWDDDLRLAMSVVDQVDALTMSRFGAADLQVSTKPDLTPVTEADTDAERAIRSMLQRTRPRDMVVGEEMGPTGHGRRQWVLDPIDGTKNFVRGGARSGRPWSRWSRTAPPWSAWCPPPRSGGAGGPRPAPGAFAGRSLSSARQLRVSSVDHLADASLSYSSLSGWEQRGLLPGFLDLTRRCWRTRAYGDFFSYMLLAEGAVDVACEPELALHDMAALVPIVAEAGGRFTSLDGTDGPWGPDAVATNGSLHAETLAVLHGSMR
jgi:histidinol-phosphatase